jgi:hypothetical protein
MLVVLAFVVFLRGSLVFCQIAPASQPTTAARPQLHSSRVDELFKALANGDRTVVPELNGAFNHVADPEEKGIIASFLLSSGISDSRYFEYLASRARAALEHPVPSPLLFDAQGNLVKGKFNPRYLSWCKKRRIAPDSFAYKALYGPAGEVYSLAASGDPRGFDLLLEALRSDNYVLAAIAAKGLAKIHDSKAIDPLIEACKKAPPDGAEAIAWGLVYFDDPKAQTAAEKFFVHKSALDAVRQDAKVQGLKGLFGY